MKLEIVYFRNGQETGREQWSGDVFGAREHGKKAVDDGVATQIEVWSDDGKLLAHWPRTLRVPPNA